jgi:hypothetical protein
MDTMIDKWIKELESKRPALLSLMQMKHGLYLTLSNSGLTASTASLASTDGASSSDESENGSLDVAVTHNLSKPKRALSERPLEVAVGPSEE